MKRWRFINKTVTGASHQRKNVPCQDYSLCVSGEDGKLPVILAVSDGHGGSKYVRSAQGAVLACEAAVEAAESYCHVFAEAEPNIIRQLAETRLKLDIIKLWRERVLTHVRDNRFSESELGLLGISQEECEKDLKEPDLTEAANVLAAYGATLLLVIITKNAIITQQLGDGDILFYQKKGGKVIAPVPADEKLLGNETTSLCSKGAAFHMRHNVSFTYGKESAADLIILATDGYANSFSSVEGCRKAASDFYELLKNEGSAYVEENMEGWLAETSREGSGDDITLVVAWRE